jgi:mycofactocin system glycosyltransferase
MTAFRLDPSYRRPGHDLVVTGGSPLRVFRLSPAGGRVLDAIERGDQPPSGHERLTERLLDAGAIHPKPERGPFRPSDVTVVIPAFGTDPDPGHLAAIIDSGVATLLVVDDGSDPPLRVAPPARVVRLEHNGGPGTARNAGLDQVGTPLVAFVDTDVDTGDGSWLDAVLAHFGDERVALVAPRIRSAPGGSAAVDGYEAVHGSLDLGPGEGRIAAGTRVAYAPAAALVCRVDALRAVHGFDGTLRYGEDVDLVWRLVEAGWRCRYEPAATVQHRNRPSASAWLAQRFHYGSSAAPLAQRHRGALAPLRISGWTAVVWSLIALRRPFAAAALAAGTVVALQRKLHHLPPQESTRLAVLGHVHAGRQIGEAVRRAWWPIALVAAAEIRRARIPLLVAVAATPIANAVRCRRDLGAVHHLAMRMADDMSYGAGVWWGVVLHRTAGPLRPDLTNWPPAKPR